MVLASIPSLLPAPLLAEMSDTTWQALIAAVLVISQALIAAFVTVYLGKKQDKTNETVETNGRNAVAAADTAAGEARGAKHEARLRATAVDDKLDSLTGTTDQIHTLSNSGRGLLLSLYAVAARQLYEATKKPEHLAAAEQAEALSRTHEISQAAANAQTVARAQNGGGKP